jgi:hypothetical protein
MVSPYLPKITAARQVLKDYEEKGVTDRVPVLKGGMLYFLCWE